MTAPKAAPIYRGWAIPERYESKPSDLDTCPLCNGPKTKHGLMCIACRRRVGRSARPVADRFWEKVDQRRPDRCWPWTGATVNGYGRINVDGKSVIAPRLAYELVHGPVPPELKVCHGCDNPICCNPAHLFLGTQADNLADMRAKGRAAPMPPRRKA